MDSARTGSDNLRPRRPIAPVEDAIESIEAHSVIAAGRAWSGVLQVREDELVRQEIEREDPAQAKRSRGMSVGAGARARMSQFGKREIERPGTG